VSEVENNVLSVLPPGRRAPFISSVYVRSAFFSTGPSPAHRY